MRNVYLGIEIGGTKLQIVAGDDSARIIECQRLNVDRTKGGAGIREQLKSTLAELVATMKPVSIGVGFGGPVDWKTGQICCSHQIEGWADFQLGDWLHTLTGLPVRVDNDANTATLGETLHGAGVGSNPVFYVTLGSGPLDPGDAWKIDVRQNGNTVEVSFPQIANRGFEVQTTTGLASPISWQTLDVPANRPFFSATNFTALVTDTITNTPFKFYRVRVFEP